MYVIGTSPVSEATIVPKLAPGATVANEPDPVLHAGPAHTVKIAPLVTAP